MPRRIEHRAEFDHPVDRVHAVLTDEGFLRERLAAVGGRHSELVSFSGGGTSGTSSASGTRAVSRQRIGAEHLPAAVRRIAPGGVTINRTETWDGRDGARYWGTVEASVQGFTGSLQGGTQLRNGAGPGGTPGRAVLLLDGTVKVAIPLVGGAIEATVVEQLGRLLQLEAEFTARWLETSRA
jgi:hypothetical protein